MKIKQQYIPWWEWEDQKAGMWRKLHKDEEPIFLHAAIEFTGCFERYGEAMKEVSLLWPNTMINSLSNVSINRRAFIGHCAAQFKINCPEYITRAAWAQLTNKQRFYADQQADKYIKEWEHHNARTNRILHPTLGKQMLLWRYS